VVCVGGGGWWGGLWVYMLLLLWGVVGDGGLEVGRRGGGVRGGEGKSG